MLGTVIRCSTATSRLADISLDARYGTGHLVAGDLFQSVSGLLALEVHDRIVVDGSGDLEQCAGWMRTACHCLSALEQYFQGRVSQSKLVLNPKP